MVNESSAKVMHKIHSACCCFGPESVTLYECRSNLGTFNFVAVVMRGADEI